MTWAAVRVSLTLYTPRPDVPGGGGKSTSVEECRDHLDDWCSLRDDVIFDLDDLASVSASDRGSVSI